MRKLFYCLLFSLPAAMFAQTERTFTLREVKVTSERIAQSNDTLTYSVVGFKQAQDRSIADVLAKMPGVEVKSNGQVVYQGKPINKFYIEGLDLMGKQYGMASKNLPASKVESVQVLENHQPVKSLRGVSFSDQAAINLVLRDDAKAVWNGTADIGLGYGDDVLYDNRIMGMRFNKTFQSLIMYKNNNNGENLGAEIVDIATLLRGRSRNEDGILSMMSVGTPNLDSKRYTLNRSHLLAGNWLWKIGEDSDFRIQTNGLLDREQMQSYSSATYLTIAGLPVITEEQDVVNLCSEWKGEANYQYNGDKTYIKNNLKGYVDFNESKGVTSVSEMTPVEMSVKPHKRSVSEDFQLSHTTEDGNVYSIDSYSSYNYLPGQLLTINGMTEHLNLRFFTTENSLQYRRKLGKIYLNNKVGLNYDNQDIQVAMNNLQSEGDSYSLFRAYYTPSINLNLGNHKIEGSAKISYVHQSYRDESTNNLWVDPILHWIWSFSALSDLSANISYTHSPLSGKSIFYTPLFSGYRTKRIGCGHPDNTEIFSVSAAYKYANPLTGLFFNIRPMFTKVFGNVLYHSSLDSEIYTTTATDHRSSTTTKGIASRISKTFGWAKTIIALNASYNISDYAMLVADQIADARMKATEISLDFSLRPIRIMAIEGKFSVRIDEQENLSASSMSAHRTIDKVHSLNIFLFPKRGWMLTAKNDLFDSSDTGIDLSYFCDLAISYKAKRWELSFAANNVFGLTEYERRMIGNTIESYSLTYLRPREFLVKWSFDI